MKRITHALSYCMLFFALILAGCGEIVEQDKIVLQFSTLGTRDIKVRNDGDASGTTLLTATRLPFIKTGKTFLIFPRGNQAYMFTKRASVESPNNEELCIAAVDGKVCFDVAVHAHLETDAPDIMPRLLNFAQTYSLARYGNTDNVLGAFVGDQLRPVLQTGYTQYGSSKTVLTLMREKTELNKWMLQYMNDKFEPFALQFTLVHVSSAMRPSDDLQKRMNDIVIQEVKNRIAQLRTDKIEPLLQEEANHINDGTEGAARLVSQARAAAIQTRDKAQRAYRTALITQIGKDGFVQFEQVRLIQEALSRGKTHIEIVPSGSVIVQNGAIATIGASK